MEENGKQNYSIHLGMIISLLFAIIFILNEIRGTLKEIYSDTHYTSASADYLENIQNIKIDNGLPMISQIRGYKKVKVKICYLL